MMLNAITRKLEQSTRMKQSNPSCKGEDSDVTRLRKGKGQKRRYKDPIESQKISEATKRGIQRAKP